MILNLFDTEVVLVLELATVAEPYPNGLYYMQCNI